MCPHGSGKYSTISIYNYIYSCMRNREDKRFSHKTKNERNKNTKSFSGQKLFFSHDKTHFHLVFVHLYMYIFFFVLLFLSSWAFHTLTCPCHLWWKVTGMRVSVCANKVLLSGTGYFCLTCLETFVFCYEWEIE